MRGLTEGARIEKEVSIRRIERMLRVAKFFLLYIYIFFLRYMGFCGISGDCEFGRGEACGDAGAISGLRVELGVAST